MRDQQKIIFISMIVTTLAAIVGLMFALFVSTGITRPVRRLLDGTRAVCIWEAESVDALRDTLEPLIGKISRNEYFTVENREGYVRPSKVPETAAVGK